MVGSKFEPVARSDYFATRVEPLSAGNVRLVLEETEDRGWGSWEIIPLLGVKFINLKLEDGSLS